MKFRKLYANEIDVRVQQVTEKGLILLLYKDARCDMNILDETVGALNWQRKHDLINGNLFCTVSIFNEKTGQWVSKQDVGTESFTEKEKGQASDSFKRACFNWGIGRELYTAPFIWVPADKCKIDKVGNKYKTNDKFGVIKITYTESGQIDGLCIKNTKTNKNVFVQMPTENKE